MTYLYISSWAGVFLYPVDVLSRGVRYARVRLRHQTRIGREKFPAGTVKARVPLGALLDNVPPVGAYVSQGGGRFKPQAKKPRRKA